MGDLAVPVRETESIRRKSVYLNVEFPRHDCKGLFWAIPPTKDKAASFPRTGALVSADGNAPKDGPIPARPVNGIRGTDYRSLVEFYRRSTKPPGSIGRPARGPAGEPCRPREYPLLPRASSFTMEELPQAILLQ